MRFIQIEGWAGAGKAILWSLLDGHKKIFVNPIHDFSHCAAFYEPDEKNFRKHLLNTEYYKLEKLSRLGYDPIDFGGNVQQENQFDFDFDLFDRKIADYFFGAQENRSIIDFVDAYATAYINSYKSKEYSIDEILYFASMGNYYEADKYYNALVMREVKTIFVRREVEGIIAARVNREKRDIDVASSRQFAPSFSDLMSVSEVESIEHYNRQMLHLQRLMPSNVYIVEFEDLVFKPRDVMLGVSDFLGVTFDEIFLTPSRDGAAIGTSEAGMVGKVNDDPSLILTRTQKFVIALHKLLYRFHGMPVNVLSMNGVALFVYKKIKAMGVFRGL